MPCVWFVMEYVQRLTQIPNLPSHDVLRVRNGVLHVLYSRKNLQTIAHTVTHNFVENHIQTEKDEEHARHIILTIFEMLWQFFDSCVRLKKKTSTITFQLDESLTNEIKNDTSDLGISTNILANQIFRRHVQWEKY